MKGIEVGEGYFVRWDWKSGTQEVIKGQHTIEVSTAFGHTENALQNIGSSGAVFGIVVEGIVRLRMDGLLHEFDRGQWFALNTSDNAALETFATSKVLLICSCGSSVPFSCGGPIEMLGRLRYIDGCTDTVLVHPWKKGEPCLNHLHIPPGTEQTMHTHPSERIGAVIRGSGWVETPEYQVRLDAGTIWRIPANGRHRFITESGSLDVIAFHPDSDYGPTHEEHPMLNRTLVAGVSAKYLDNIRTRDV